MSVSNQVVDQLFVGNGVTTTFQIPCAFVEGSAEDVLDVYTIDALGNMTLVTKGVDYEFDDEDLPVNVIYDVAPDAGEFVWLVRSSPAIQQTDYINTGRFAAESHEKQMDRIIFLVQELKEKLDRSLLTSPLQAINPNIIKGAAGQIPTLNTDADGWSWMESNEVANPSIQTNHVITDGQAATDLTDETIDAADYTSVWIFYEIIRGTSVFSTGYMKLHYRDTTWYVVMGQDDSDDSASPHGVTFTVTGTTVAQLRAACDVSAGDGTVKLRRFFYV